MEKNNGSKKEKNLLIPEWFQDEEELLQLRFGHGLLDLIKLKIDFKKLEKELKAEN